MTLLTSKQNEFFNKYKKLFKTLLSEGFTFPYNAFLTNETFADQRKDKIKRIYLSKIEKTDFMGEIAYLNDKQTCENLINLLRNSMKFHVEILDDNESFISSLNSMITLKPKSQEIITSLHDCITNFQLMEKLDKENEYYCSKCCKNQGA